MTNGQVDAFFGAPDVLLASHLTSTSARATGLLRQGTSVSIFDAYAARLRPAAPVPHPRGSVLRASIT